VGILKLLLALLADISEYVIKNEVSGWLLSKDKGLDELLELGGFV